MEILDDVPKTRHIVDFGETGVRSCHTLEVLDYNHLNITQNSDWELNVRLGVVAVQVLVTLEQERQLCAKILGEGPHGIHQWVYCPGALKKTVDQDGIALQRDADMMEVPGEADALLFFDRTDVRQ